MGSDMFYVGDQSFDLKALGIAAFAILVFSNNVIGQYAVTYRYPTSMSMFHENLEWQRESITQMRL